MRRRSTRGSRRPARQARSDGAALAGDPSKLSEMDQQQRRPRVPNAIPALSLDRVYKLFGNKRRVRAASAAIASGTVGDRDALKGAYGVFAALAGVDLHVAPREILVIVGASGSGKSTLIRHMNGLNRPSWPGRGGWRAAALHAATGAATLGTTREMVFQSTSLFPHRTVIDNVTLAWKSGAWRAKRVMPLPGCGLTAWSWVNGQINIQVSCPAECSSAWAWLEPLRPIPRRSF